MNTKEFPLAYHYPFIIIYGIRGGIKHNKSKTELNIIFNDLFKNLEVNRDSFTEMQFSQISYHNDCIVLYLTFKHLTPYMNLKKFKKIFDFNFDISNSTVNKIYDELSKEGYFKLLDSMKKKDTLIFNLL